MGMNMDKVIINIEKVANTTAGTIPIALAHADSDVSENIRDPQRLLLTIDCRDVSVRPRDAHQYVFTRAFPRRNMYPIVSFVAVDHQVAFDNLRDHVTRQELSVFQMFYGQSLSRTNSLSHPFRC